MVIFSWGGGGVTRADYFLVFFGPICFGDNTRFFCAIQNGSQNIQRNGRLLIPLSWTLAIWCTLLSFVLWYNSAYRLLFWLCLSRSQNHHLKTHDLGWNPRLHGHAIFGVVSMLDTGTGTTRWISVSDECHFFFFSFLRHGSDMFDTPTMKKKKSQILTDGLTNTIDFVIYLKTKKQV